MKANELRVGNLFSWCSTGEIGVVEDISTSTNGYHNINNINIKDCSPIKLTEEWLLKLGFKKSFEIWNKYTLDRYNSISEYEELSFSYLNFLGFVKKIKCVHELQNLYFALTGEELIINT